MKLKPGSGRNIIDRRGQTDVSNPRRVSMDPNDPANKRTQLARAIGRQMSAESKKKKQQYASAQDLDNQGANADANRLRKQADSSFDKAKKGMTDRLKAGGM